MVYYYNGFIYIYINMYWHINKSLQLNRYVSHINKSLQLNHEKGPV